MLKEVNFESLSDEVRKKEALNKETGIHLSVHLLLIIVQVSTFVLWTSSENALMSSRKSQLVK